MQTLYPSSNISTWSIMQRPSHRVAFTNQLPAHPNATNPVISSPVPTINNHFVSGGVGKNRTDWQSSCAILASKVVLQHHNTTEKTSDKDNITFVDDYKTPDLVPVNKIPKPLIITDLSRLTNHGSTLRVAFQGVSGAYTETAAEKAYPDCEGIPCTDFEAAFQSVELWIADRAILPVEDSFGGSIHRNYDLLLRHRLHIVGEIQISFNHCLLALPGVKNEDINRVISHPQAFAHCELTLNKLGLNSREAVHDTAFAAKIVAENSLLDTAAIASARAAELYNLNILADGIQDDSSNVTRFLMLAREPIIARGDRPFKTSIVFAQDRGTSNLFKVLSAFAFRNIKLTKIESRPNRDRPVRVVDHANVGIAKHFEYMFYVDFEASMSDVRAQNALAEVQQFTSFLRVLGSYPMDIMNN